MLPTSFLRQLIRLYGDALQSVVPGYLEASMETFSRNQERLRETFVANPAMASFETLARSNIEWMERAMRMFGGFPTPPGGGETHGPGAGAGPGGGQGVGPGGSHGAGTPSAGPVGTGAEAAAAAAAGIGEDLDHLQQQLREMQAQLEKLSKTSDGGKG